MKTTGATSQHSAVADTKQPSKIEQKGKVHKEFKNVLEEKGPEKIEVPGRRGERAVRVDSHHQADIAEKKELKQGSLAEKKELKHAGIGEKKELKHAGIGEKKELKQSEKKEFKQFIAEKKDLQKGVQEKSGLPSKEEKKIKEEKDLTMPSPILMGPSTVQSKVAAEKVAEHHSVLNIKEIQTIVERVQVGVNEKGLPEFQFELNTQNLGPMNLKITSDKDGIKLQFVMQNAAAQKTLENNIGDLTKALQERGMNLAAANFTTRDRVSSPEQRETPEEGSHERDASGGRRRRVERKKREDEDDYTI